MNEKHVKFVLRSLSVILLLCTMLSIVPLPAAAAYNYTSIKTGEQLAAAAVTIATEFKTLYVYGCFGAPLTEKNKERYCNNYDYNKQPARTAMIKAASSDTFGFDCVCLIKGILWGWKGDVNATYGGAKYASNGVPDKSANGLFDLCTEKSTDFTDIEIGEMVWMDGHIGVYVGNGLAVECTPAWDNKVQITACNRNVEGYNRRNWTKHGKLPYIEYTDTTYLKSCTAYDSYCEIKVTKDAAPIRDLPCSESTVSTVKVVENAAINTTYKAIGLYMNTANNLWYKVETKNGKLGYIYAGNTSFVKQLTDDCTVSGASSPSKLIKGYAYSIKGTVAAKYQTLTAVGAWVNDSNGRYATGGTETKTAKSYNLSSSKVDAAVKFNELGVGIFTYHIGATLKTHYASDAKTVSTKSQTVTIYNSAFSVVPFEFSRYNKTISGVNTDIDAVVGVSIKKAESSKVNSYAATIYENGVAIGSISAPSSGWVGEDAPMFWWKASQMGLTLKPGTKYQYTFTINVEGYTLTSQKYDFQTTGSSTYTVTYNANGGTGAPSSQTKKYGVALTLSTTKPTRGGYVFKGWATAQNSSTVAYAPGATFNENKNLSLYAVWEEDIKPATITKQPTSVTVAMGETASTTVEATGDGLTYTWYYTSNGNTNQFFVSSVTSATYTTTMDATRDGRKVYCVITDKYGNSVTTNTVTLSMKSGLAITKQPTSVTVANGEKVATTVTATGEGLTYTWYYTSNGKVNEFYVSSVTGATYTTTMDSTRDGRKVYCVITDKYGNTVKTNTVTLSMKSGLAITKQPTNVTVANGEKAATTVTATGEGLTYTWYYTSNGKVNEFYVSSVTGATYSTTMDATRNGRKVYCVITDKYGNSVTTNTVTLSMKSGLAITKQPTSVTVANGSKAATTVTATGEGLTYTWYYTLNKNGVEFYKSSVTGATYTTTMDESRAGRKVYCVITDKYGNTVKTNTVTLSMKSGPLAITKQPTNVTVANGSKASTTVTATGEGLTYTWYYTLNKNGVEFYKSSVTGATYSTTMDSTRDGRKVYCVITDKYGNTVKTNTVTLSMK